MSSPVILRGMAVVAAACATLLFGSAASAAPKIISPEPVFDFGSADNSSKVQHDFIIKNVGDEPLEIARVKTSCGCTVAELKKKTLAPGEETPVSVALSLKGKKGEQVKDIMVESNDPAQPLYKLQIRGQSLAAVSIEPSNIMLQVLDDESHEQIVRVTSNKKNKPLTILSAESTLPAFTAEVREVEAGQVYDVVVRNPEPLPVGTLRGPITLHTDSKEEPTIQIHLNATVIGPVEVRPPSLVVRAGAAGQTTQQVLQVNAGRVKAFNLTEVVVPVEGMQAAIEKRGEGKFLVRISQIPLDGTLEGKSLILKTDIAGTPEIQVPIQVNKPRVRTRPATTPGATTAPVAPSKEAPASK